MNTTESSTAQKTSSTVQREQKSAVSHFWFCCYPGFSTRILFSSVQRLSLSETSIIEVYDCDGELVNVAEVQFQDLPLGMLDLDPLVSSCKLESGLKHGHVVVRSAPEVQHQCRIQSRKSGIFFSIQRDVLKRRDLFVPICFAPDKTNYIALFNQSTDVSEVLARVFCGSRTPRADLEVPAMGARIFQLESLFPEYGYADDSTVQRAYLRLSLRNGGATGCTAFDRQLVQQDQDIFRSIG
jgi:hypothetical protein